MLLGAGILIIDELTDEGFSLTPKLINCLENYKKSIYRSMNVFNFQV